MSTETEKTEAVACPKCGTAHEGKEGVICAGCSDEWALCAHCDEAFEHGQGGTSVEGIGDLCENCRYDHGGQECAVCGEEYGHQGRYWSRCVLLNHEFIEHADRLIMPGFYLPAGNFYSAAVIGPGHISDDALLFVRGCDTKDLPEMSGYVCKGCGDKEGVDRQGLAMYGERPARKWYEPSAKHPEAEIENAALRAWMIDHPQHVRDLEAELDEEVWERLRLEPMQTWNDWLALDYMGIKIYHQCESNLRYYRPSGHPEGLGWLTTVRGPTGRSGGHGRGGFCASDLPWWHAAQNKLRPFVRKKTRRWYRDMKAKGVISDWDEPHEDPLLLRKWERQMLRRAISAGLLDADGFHPERERDCRSCGKANHGSEPCRCVICGGKKPTHQSCCLDGNYRPVHLRCSEAWRADHPETGDCETTL